VFGEGSFVLHHTKHVSFDLIINIYKGYIQAMGAHFEAGWSHLLVGSSVIRAT